MRIFVLILLSFLGTEYSHANGSLSPNMLFKSKTLGYSLHYRVYLPEISDKNIKVSTLYVVDGQWFIKYGNIIKVINNEINQGKIKPIVVVFIDSRNPEDLRNNRRNQEFFCNAKYLGFFVNELMPSVEEDYSVMSTRESRVIAGVSFGGLNAACFGRGASHVFGGIAMLSPANTKFLKIVSNSYEQADIKKLKVFISGGRKNDNLSAIRHFKNVLVSNGHDVNYKVVRFGHNWDNWQPLLDDLLVTFFKQNKKPPY
ncbi:alpha/beta hydrolase [Colwellia psychrerythraea]|uniref:Esterase n=1 Tax=Colwellia psychrerythraea TaxID=28229 RepID=A0A099KAK9_COLPS|nr:alpha/beta hydrolase-fold protein [Colwellia psychrerythraea]KGJ87759.1 esterase [Colwellia psychrerythraea]